MSKGKWKTPRTDTKVQVGGKMNPVLAAWVKQNGGFPTVEKAVEFYKKSLEKAVMLKQFTASEKTFIPRQSLGDVEQWECGGDLFVVAKPATRKKIKNEYHNICLNDERYGTEFKK